MFMITALVIVTLVSGEQRASVHFMRNLIFYTEAECDFGRSYRAIPIAKVAADAATKEISAEDIRETRITTECRPVKGM